MQTDEFLDVLVRHWHNLRQAQSSPTSFAYVHYEWYYDDGVLKTKQWYDYNPHEAYRARDHKVRPPVCDLHTAVSFRRFFLLSYLHT